jgi:ribose-phosphate pyrophosphokinase
MLELNLINEGQNDIKYKISKYPDGQQDLTITKLGVITPVRGVDEVVIKSRLKNFKDLELIICANQALIEMGVKTIKLYVPYFIGARSDRKFVYGGVNYIKHVIAPIINSQNFDSVTVVDPHSDVLEACINNFNKINNFNLVKFALTDIDNKNGTQDRICLVSPDAGAYKKIFDVAAHFNIDNLITATKVRDIKTGKIIHTEVPNIDKSKNFKYVIVDDICDGGRTFVEIAKAIKEKDENAKIYLIVTHGIFSNSFYELSKLFEKVYSTNSYSDIDVESHSDYTVPNGFLKQLNVY